MSVLDPPRAGTQPTRAPEGPPEANRWADRPVLAITLKAMVLLTPIVLSVVFVAIVSRLVPRPAGWFGVALWWVGLTLASTVVLAATERVMRKVMPLVALFNLSLVFPDHAPSRFKVALRTNTLRQLERALEAGEVDQPDFQEAAERLVSLAGALNNHDRKTRGHTERVRAYTLMIGEELHLPKGDLDKLHWAGLVHDIGKLEVPPEILNKTGRPDDDEWEILKQHPAAAVPLLEPLRPWLGEWADAASQHHERWDGKGYPLGLAGEQISLSGRIVAVADAYDVMTSVRSYKKAMSPQAARAELLRCAGTQFDADVVRAFLNISVGKLRLVMGPLSWIAQAPVLGNIPLGTAAVTAGSSLVSVGIAVAAGLTAAAVPADPVIPDAAPPAVVIDVPVARPMLVRGLEDQPIPMPSSSFGDTPPSTISITGVPDNLRVDPVAPSTLIPRDNWFGRSIGEYQACWDDVCSSAVLEVEVEPVNDVPVARPDGATTPAGIAVTIDVLSNDVDVEDGRPSLTAVGVDSPASAGEAVRTPDARVRFQPAGGFVGTVGLWYEVVDLDGATAIGTVTVEVLELGGLPEPVIEASPAPPTTSPSPPPTTAPPTTSPATTPRPDAVPMLEDAAPTDIDVLANDTSSDGDPSDGTISITAAPAAGTASVVDGRVRYQPDPDANGVDNLTYQLCEATDRCDSTTVTVTVTPRNDPPRFTGGAPVTVLEDSGPSSIDAWATAIAPGPANESAQRVGFTVTVDQPALFAALPAVGSAGTLTFTPAADANGVATISVTAVDDGGTADGGNDTSAVYTATITVTPVNDPVLAADDAATIAEDTAAGVIVDVLANDTDADNDPLSVIAIDVTTVTGGTVTDLGAGSVSYTPDEHFYGTETFGYTVSDGNGSTDTAVVTITVTPVPDAPVATADAFTTSEDTPRVVPAPGLLANDYDYDHEALTVSLTPVVGPSNGSVSLGNDGSFTYTPNLGFVGVDTFTYRVNDPTGLTATATVTMTVDSGLTNGALYLGSTRTMGIWSLTTAPSAVATPEPDHDADGRPGITVTQNGLRSVQSWNRPISGSALVLNGPVTLELWSTIAGFEDDEGGHPDVTLYDCNGSGSSCVAVAQTDVHFDEYNRGVANWVRVDLSLGNVAHTFSIGRQLVLEVRHRHETLWVASSGTRPSRLVYTVANTAPTANDDTAPTILEDAAATPIDVLANDVDTNLDPASVTIVSPPTLGAATPAPDGTISYLPNTNANGDDSFTYRVCDSGGLCDTATVALSVAPVNDRPSFTGGADITASATGGSSSSPGWATTISAGPADESGQTLGFTVTAANPALFSVQPTIGPTGTLTFTPSGVVGTTTISIVLTDNGGTVNGGVDTSSTRIATITLT